MAAAHIPPFSSRPYLKSSCDLALQNHFGDGQWSQVINLTKQRFKSTKDPYYEAVLVAAQSQLDTPSDEHAAHVAVSKLLQNGTVIKDADALDLYEWACSNSGMNYSETIGHLRSQLVKALPKDLQAGLRCFDACIWNSDFLNAQLIAASLDRNSGKREHAFKNICTTFILSGSSQCPPDKKALFSMLCKRQIEKALELRTTAPDLSSLPDRAIVNEAEMLLYLEIVVKPASDADVAKLLQLPALNPTTYLDLGWIEVFEQIMRQMERAQAWDQIYQTAVEIFGTPDKNDATQQVAGSWFLWGLSIEAAKKQDDTKQALKKISRLVNKATLVPKPHPIHAMNLAIVNLMLMFERTEPSGDTTGPRVRNLVSFVEEHFKKVSCFDEILPFLEKLTFPELKAFLTNIAEIGKEGPGKETSGSNPKKPNASEGLMVLTLRLRVRYAILRFPSLREPKPVKTDTPGKANSVCKMCGAETNQECRNCLIAILDEATKLYGQSWMDRNTVKSPSSNPGADPLTDITIIGATCLLKLAGFSAELLSTSEQTSPFDFVDPQMFLEAVLWLQFRFDVAPTDKLRLLLVKLYLLMGCVSLADKLWTPLDVKNITLDSLGPLRLDRLSSLSPGVFKPDSSGRPSRTAKIFVDYFNNAIRRTEPQKVQDGFREGSYKELLSALVMWDRLKRSSTLATAIVENRRAIRALTGKNDSPISDDPLAGRIPLQTKFEHALDANEIPNHESRFSKPFAELISIGPNPSDLRTHLSLAAERLVDLFSGSHAKEAKTVKSEPLSKIDRDNVAIICKHIGSILSGSLVLDDENKEEKLTGPEQHYYTVVLACGNFVDAVLGNAEAETISASALSLNEALDDQRKAWATVSASGKEAGALLGFASLHGTSMLRESSLIVRSMVLYLKAALEKPASKAGLPKGLSEHLKTLDSAADKAKQAVRDRTKQLDSALKESAWLDRIRTWTFGEDSDNWDDEAEWDDDWSRAQRIFSLVGGSSTTEVWASDILESWRDIQKGWNVIKLD